METTRLILFISLGLVLTMIWQAWQEDYGQTGPTPGANIEQSLNNDGSLEEDVPEAVDIPKPVAEKESVEDLPYAEETNQGQIVKVVTDVFEIDINTTGATIQKLSLLNYPISKKEPEKPVVLLRKDERGFYLLQGGILSKGNTANHKASFSTKQFQYQLKDSQQIKVPFVWESEDGFKVTKTYTFYKGQYLVDVNYEVVNNTGNVWTGSAYSQINRTDQIDTGSKFIYTYTGAVISSPEKRYEKIDFDDIHDDRLSMEIKDGWVAMLQHYFITALLPGSNQETYNYYTLNPNNDSYVIGSISPSKKLTPGEEGNFNHKIYFGPKTQKELEKIAPGLELTVDYGIFWFIAKPLFWVLDNIHTYTNNWGWAIIIVTILLKIVFYRLSAAGYRSMANMRRVQPRLLAIRDRYKDDRARLNQAMMDIYKEEKINPLGGCFPILVQIPVFISLYWVLLESVELRQADFILWINDLSIPDPYFVLPLLMGVTMYVQQKLNPAPMDPVQEKVMSILPFVFTIFFAFFPSGLVLYWVVNNILSIAQQWAITRSLEKSGLSKQ